MKCDSTINGRPRKAALLECNHVRFAYGRDMVLDDVTLGINEANFMGVIGPNGCGKSTLIKILSGLLSPQEGEVSMDGRDMSGLTRRHVARQLAVVAQEETTDFGFTVREEIMLGRAPHHGGLHFENHADRNIVEEVMTMTRVSHLADRRMEALSGGERQRVRTARALAQEPRVLLLDEPTNHLDLYSQLSLVELMRGINDQGIAILVVSHDINFVAGSCNHVKVLHDGSFRFSGAPDQVITPENLARAFNIEAMVDRNPATGAPRMTPVARLDNLRPRPFPDTSSPDTSSEA
jgi:iron complex transport system ATP-binding protein